MKNDNNTKDWKKVREESERIIDEQEAEQNQWPDEDILTDDNTESALSHEDYANLQKELTLAEQKAFDNEDKARRALAELENYRQRAQKDVDEALRYGKGKIIDSLLPVIDSLEQALQLVEKEAYPGMAEGLELTMQMFLDALKKNGVEQIDPIGNMFDPNEHEAMTVQVLPDAVPNSIVTVFQKGYKLNDRVIRPARVIVAKN